MDKKDRQKIVFEIGDLVERHCKGCSYNGRTNRGNNEHCITQCDIGKRLRVLGGQMDIAKPKVMEVNGLNEAIYLDLKEIMTDMEICAEYGIDKNKMYKLKKAWGVVGRRKKPKKELVK